MKAEVAATKQVLDAVSELSVDAGVRVLTSVLTLIQPTSLQFPKADIRHTVDAEHRGETSEQQHLDDPPFNSLADLWAAAQPKSGPSEVLVVAYWHQVIQSKETWTGQAINDDLKNLGHAQTNITKTVDRLKERKPAQMLQVKKSGTGKQARKLYKLTSAGITVVRKMLDSGGESPSD